MDPKLLNNAKTESKIRYLEACYAVDHATAEKIVNTITDVARLAKDADLHCALWDLPRDASLKIAYKRTLEDMALDAERENLNLYRKFTRALWCWRLRGIVGA